VRGLTFPRGGGVVLYGKTQLVHETHTRYILVTCQSRVMCGKYSCRFRTTITRYIMITCLNMVHYVSNIYKIPKSDQAHSSQYYVISNIYITIF